MAKLFKNIWYGILFLCSVTTVQVYAQNINPFEIEGRMDSAMSVIGYTPILHSDSIIYIDTNSVSSLNQKSLSLYENPFDVSHIPLRKREFQKEEKLETTATKSNSFPFWMILFSCALLAIVMSLNRSVLIKIRRSILNDNMMRVLQREEKGGNSFILLTLYVIFVINTTLFISMAIKHYSPDKLPAFIVVMLGILTVLIIRHFSMFIIGLGFPVKKESSQFNFTIILFNIVVGIILIPINLMLSYGPKIMFLPMIYFGIGVMTIVFVLRQLRGLFIAFRFINYYKFHFFLYLCTCEIAPLFILVKILAK